jgi:1-acyl-sn-glycerol-3-phosphate acyltransferase
MTETTVEASAPAHAAGAKAPQPRAARRKRDAAHDDVANAVRPENRLWIRFLQAVDVCYARIYHRVNVLSPQRLPKQGPAILICNHISGLDPFFIQAVCPRLIVWMMAKEYYEIRGLKTILKSIEAIPVDRGGRDLAATRSALRALEANRILGVFPEGKIETLNDLLPFQTGVALMAIKAGVPVYPAYIDGTQRGREMHQAFLYPNIATLAFGPAVEYPAASTSKEVLQDATNAFTAAVTRLKRLMEASAPGRRA